MVAALGVGCVLMTAAAADPSAMTAPGDRPTDVFALGEGGFGTLDTDLVMPERWRGDVDASPRGSTGTGTGEGGEVVPEDLVLAGAGVTPFGDTFGNPFSDTYGGTVEIADLGGDEVLGSVIPAGLSGQVPELTVRAYRAAQEVLAREDPGCRIDWALLAGIGRVESNHGRFGGATVTIDGVSVPAILGARLDGSLAGTMVIRDTDGGALDRDGVYDRAVGPMQFLPGTWQRWGSDGDRDGASDPQDIDDAALAAARYLCSGDGGLDTVAGASAAVRRYNNSQEYVDKVLGIAGGYRDGAALVSGGELGGVTGVGRSDDQFLGGTGGHGGGAGSWSGGGGWIASPAPASRPGWVPPPVRVVQAPTAAPTAAPTTAPTARPSTRPTGATVPPASSSAPTTTPTRVPTTRPPGSPRPSGQPTTAPPSGGPTSVPPSSVPPTSVPPSSVPPSSVPPSSVPPSSVPPSSVPPSSVPPSPVPPVPVPSTGPSGGPTCTPVPTPTPGDPGTTGPEVDADGATDPVPPTDPCSPPCPTPAPGQDPPVDPAPPVPTCRPVVSDPTPTVPSAEG